MSTVLPKQARKHSDLRDRFFYIGVALVFAALGVGLQYIAPVLSYDCRRDASGVVNCAVQSRMYGLIPLPAQELSHIVSADSETSETSTEDRRDGVYRRFLQTYDVLVLACADGSRWRSFRSTDPLGQSNPDVARGVNDLLSASSPGVFHAWTGEKVPLLLAWAFLAPLTIVLLAVLLRVWLFRGQKAEQLYADLRPTLDARLAAARGLMSAGDPCRNGTCTGTVNEQGVCDTCGTPAPEQV